MNSMTRFDRAVERLKNNRALVGILLLLVGITGVGQVVGGIESIRNFWNGVRARPVQEEARIELHRKGRAFSEGDFLASIRKGDRAICGLYLDAGMSANTKNPQGGSALYLAAASCQDEIIDLLVDYGARVNDRNESNLKATPLLIAMAKCERQEPAVHLLQRGADPDSMSDIGLNPLRIAIVKNKPDLIRELVRRGVDVNYRFFDGASPLMDAAEGGNLEIAKILLEAGAALSARDDAGKSALDHAESREMKQLLINIKQEP